MMRAVTLFLICCISLSVGLTSCSNTSFSDMQRSRYEEMWQEQNITAYDYTFSMYCNCPEETVRKAQVLVRNDIVTSARYLDTDEFVSESSVFATYPSITEIFKQLESAALNNIPFDVQYNAAFGYPEEISMGFLNTTSQIDWYELRIENLLVIQ